MVEERLQKVESGVGYLEMLKNYINKIKIFIKTSERQWIFFLLTSLSIGTVLVFANPPLWGADEHHHFTRAYTIARGQLDQDTKDVGGVSSVNGAIPSAIVELSDLRNKDTRSAVGGWTKEVDSVDDYIELLKANLSDGESEANPFGSIIYRPIVYTSPAIGIFLANMFNPTLGWVLLSARLFSLFAYVGVVTFAIARLGKSSVSWIILVVALLPTSIYQAATVNADSLLLAFSLLLFSYISSLLLGKKEVSWRLILGILISSIMISVIKLPYTILIMTLLFFSVGKNTPKMKRYIIRFGIPLVSILIAGMIFLSNSVSSVGYTPGDVSVALQMKYIVYHPINYAVAVLDTFLQKDWLSAAVGTQTTLLLSTPIIFTQILMWVMVVLTFFHITNSSGKIISNIKTWDSFVLIGASALAVVALATTLYLVHTPVGSSPIQGLQGRYFLPILPFFILGISILMRNAKISLVSMNERMTKAIMIAIVVTLVLSLGWFVRVMY